MRSINIYKLGFFYILLLVILSACSKMNDLHNKYLKNGETIYIGKPDSVVALAGKERVKLRYWVTDPKAVKMVIYWSSRADSMVIDIPSHSANDSLEVIVPNLPENSYSFELVTMNKNNNYRSVPKNILGHSYGKEYQSTIANRAIQSATQSSKEGIRINWLNAPENAISSELAYVDTLGDSVKRFVPDTAYISTIIDAEGGIKYRTLYLPEPTAIDTFYTEFDTASIVTITERIMDKSLFSRWNPPGIPYSNLSATYKIEKIWDDNINTFWITKSNGLPYSLTFDMGKEVELKRFIVWQRQLISLLFGNQNTKKFQLWGSATPNVSADFAGWVHLGDYEVIKPSGLPLGTNSAEDLQAAADGAHFDIAPNVPVRYLRFVLTEDWDGIQLYSTFGEMTFYEAL